MVKKNSSPYRNLSSRNWLNSFDYHIEFAFIAYSTLSADRMLARFTEVLRRQTECFRKWIEYSVARQSICSCSI